jgi:hypothetical protein
VPSAQTKSLQQGRVVEIRSTPISPAIEPVEDCTPFLLEVERMVDRAMQCDQIEDNGLAGSQKNSSASDMGTADAAEHRVHGFVDESRFERFLPERRKGSCQ